MVTEAAPSQAGRAGEPRGSPGHGVSWGRGVRAAGEAGGQHEGEGGEGDSSGGGGRQHVLGAGPGAGLGHPAPAIRVVGDDLRGGPLARPPSGRGVGGLVVVIVVVRY